jgi:hypothetical protein
MLQIHSDDMEKYLLPPYMHVSGTLSKISKGQIQIKKQRLLL